MLKSLRETKATSMLSKREWQNNIKKQNELSKNVSKFKRGGNAFKSQPRSAKGDNVFTQETDKKRNDESIFPKMFNSVEKLATAEQRRD